MLRDNHDGYFKPIQRMKDCEEETDPLPSPNKKASKKLEVLTVIFPDIDEITLDEVYQDFDCDIQAAVEYLLRKKRRDGEEIRTDDDCGTKIKDNRDSPQSKVEDAGKISQKNKQTREKCHRIETIIKKENSREDEKRDIEIANNKSENQKYLYATFDRLDCISS